jgi:hypothetical protein
MQAASQRRQEQMRVEQLQVGDSREGDWVEVQEQLFCLKSVTVAALGSEFNDCGSNRIGTCSRLVRAAMDNKFAAGFAARR